MKLKSKNLGSWWVTILFVSFAHSCAHKLKLRSEPSGATVRAELPNGKPGAQLGKTPLELALPRDGKAFAVTLILDDYETRTIYVPVTDASEIEINTALKKIDEKWFSEKFMSSQSNAFSQKFAQLLTLQNQIIERNFQQVDKLEKEMKPQFEAVSVWNSLMGNSYLLRGNKNMARKYYKRAVDLDPTNNEAKTLLRED